MGPVEVAGDQKKANDEGRTIVFLDESGFYLLPAVVKTWAPQGETPQLTAPLKRDHLSVISAITLDGELYSQIQRETFTSEGVIGFLCHLFVQIGRKLLVVWDGAPIHKSREIKAFLESSKDQIIHAERFPPYAPEIDPDEQVWHQLKYVELRNLVSHTLQQLEGRVRRAIKRLRNRVQTIRNFVRHAGLET